MSEWREKENGNYVYVDDGVITTIFRRADGEWYGIRDALMTEKGFGNPDSVMDAIDGERVKFSERVQPRYTGWRAAKKGGFYRQTAAGIVMVRQARSGKWYVTVNGRMIKGHWLNTKDEAIKLADRYMC